MGECSKELCILPLVLLLRQLRQPNAIAGMCTISSSGMNMSSPIGAAAVSPRINGMHILSQPSDVAIGDGADSLDGSLTPFNQ